MHPGGRRRGIPNKKNYALFVGGQSDRYPVDLPVVGRVHQLHRDGFGIATQVLRGNTDGQHGAGGGKGRGGIDYRSNGGIFSNGLRRKAGIGIVAGVKEIAG